MLHDDSALRQKKADFMLRVFDAAVLLGVDAVCGFVGRNQQHSMDENLGDFEEHFIPLLKAAKDRGLTYRVEQCPMPGWTTPPVTPALFIAVAGLAPPQRSGTQGYRGVSQAGTQAGPPQGAGQ